MPKINSREKGARFERELAKAFRSHGYDEARRTAQYCGNTGDASDVVGLPGLHIEAKHCEKMQLYDWIAQAVRDAEANGGGNLPAVFHKKNYADILVTMRFDDFMQIYKEWEAGKMPIKTSELCDNCKYDIEYCKEICRRCDSCAQHTNDTPHCKCLNVLHGELCPYYIKRS